MSTTFDRRFDRLVTENTRNHLAGGRKGIEKESLRVDANGLLSLLPHPTALGSPLTNSYVTTDFSEALLEFVTPAYPTTWETLRFLCDIHQFTYSRLDHELLWVTSMPCAIPAEREIPLAQYGSSNVARMKTVYRNGLSYRYGRNMQTIAGIHFNYSLPDDFWPIFQKIEKHVGSLDDLRSSAYFSLVRNVRRFGWIILYLFGASPAMCKTFAGGKDTGMPSLDENTYFQPFATSLRMSDLGYSNNTQSRLNISLNSLDEYVSDLSRAISTPEPAYVKIGTKVDGEYRQLNANQLQIENEYYNTVRPKRVARPGERPTAALRRGGVEYVELRSLDINIFDPVGVSQNTMRFVEAFLIYCVLEESPPFDSSHYLEVAQNHSTTATRGRQEGFALQRNGKPVLLRDWATEILGRVRRVADVIDQESEHDDYVQAIDAQLELVNDPETTPSARILKDLKDTGSGFFHYALAAAESHKNYFTEIVQPEPSRTQALEDEVARSLKAQLEIEASDDVDFDEYLRRWFNG